MERYEGCLLDLLAQKLDCYVSDLREMVERSICVKENVLKAVSEVPASLFPVKEWNTAIEYMMDETKEFNEPGNARAYLMAALRQSC